MIKKKKKKREIYLLLFPFHTFSCHFVQENVFDNILSCFPNNSLAEKLTNRLLKKIVTFHVFPFLPRVFETYKQGGTQQAKHITTDLIKTDI